MNHRERLAEIKARLTELSEVADRDLTDDETAEVDSLAKEHEEVAAKVQKADAARARVKQLSAVSVTEPEKPEGVKSEPGSFSERFVKSASYLAFKEMAPSGETEQPIRIQAKGQVGRDLADLGIGTKATITTGTGQFVSENRIPGYRSELLDDPVTFLDLVTSGTTNASFIEYARIVSETDNAAVVPEGELKPLSDVATDKGEAKAYTYADGFDVTNQTLADDGALVAFMDGRIRWHVRNLVEDMLLNGSGAAGVPLGILATTGVQQQAYATDVITTIGRAIEKVEAVQANTQAIVMNAADIWTLKLTTKLSTGEYVFGGPQAAGAFNLWGIPVVKSNRVVAGTALVGNFKSVQFLQREPLSVVAFNQHKDYAQRNMAYVRAELRALQLFYAPREVVVADLTA